MIVMYTFAKFDSLQSKPMHNIISYITFGISVDSLPLPRPGEVDECGEGPDDDDDDFASAPFIKLYCDADDDALLF